MQVLSKLVPSGTISATCTEYVHPWINNCPKGGSNDLIYEIFIKNIILASIGMGVCAFKDSLRIYCTVYLVNFFAFIDRD